MPWLDCESQVKIPDSKLQEAASHDVEEFAKIPELHEVSYLFLNARMY